MQTTLFIIYGSSSQALILRSLTINKWKIEIWRDIKCVSRGFIDVVLKEIECDCINNQTVNEKSFSGNIDGHCSI